MNAPLTRRALLGASTVAIGAVAIPAAALAHATSSPACDADTVLLGLIARHEKITAVWDAATDAYNAASDCANEAYPPRPEVLTHTLNDLIHGLTGKGRDRRPNGRPWSFFDLDDVDRLRLTGPVMSLAWCNDGGPLPSVPNPAGERRRQEILATADRWLAHRQAVDDRVGFTAAIKAEEAAARSVEEVEMAIMDTAPVTLAGFRLKARWIAASKQPGDWAESLLRDLCGGMAS